jgi:hypothetical protein
VARKPLADEKLAVVLSVLTGETTQVEIARRLQMSQTTIARPPSPSGRSISWKVRVPARPVIRTRPTAPSAPSRAATLSEADFRDWIAERCRWGHIGPESPHPDRRWDGRGGASSRKLKHP